MSWLPPLLPQLDYIVQFQYNITLYDTTSNTATVLTTNTTSIVISPDHIYNYTKCNTYYWTVSAGTDYGYSNVIVSTDNFTIISGNCIVYIYNY